MSWLREVNLRSDGFEFLHFLGNPFRRQVVGLLRHDRRGLYQVCCEQLLGNSILLLLEWWINFVLRISSHWGIYFPWRCVVLLWSNWLEVFFRLHFLSRWCSDTVSVCKYICFRLLRFQLQWRLRRMFLILKPFPLNFKYSVQWLLKWALISKLALIGQINRGLLNNFMLNNFMDLLSFPHAYCPIIFFHLFEVEVSLCLSKTLAPCLIILLDFGIYLLLVLFVFQTLNWFTFL
jgi:hypothetical protein